MVLVSLNQRKELATTRDNNHNPESVVREIRRKTGMKYSSEEKIRIVPEDLKGEEKDIIYSP
jgi:hypothetical protein